MGAWGGERGAGRYGREGGREGEGLYVKVPLGEVGDSHVEP